MTGVFCFDSWLRNVREKGIKIMLQYHDEIGLRLLKGQEDEVDKKLKESINQVNKQLNLNVPLSVSIQYGDTYSNIH
jgi:DNA polymerase I-like protein with 3'-5' exonuclease and polymerase domains